MPRPIGQNHVQTTTIEEFDSGEDSDIQEIAIIMPAERRPASSGQGLTPLPLLKRRKSSPQMDPIPSYNITPTTSSHIIDQHRARGGGSDPYGGSAISGLIVSDDYYSSQPVYESPGSSSLYSNNSTMPDYHQHHQRQETHPSYSSSRAPTSTSSSSSSSRHTRSSHSHHANDDYEPLLQPSPHVRSLSCISDSSASNHVPTSTTSRPPAARRPVVPERTFRPGQPGSSSVPRPVSSALAQAVSRRRDSLAQQKEQQQKQEIERAQILNRSESFNPHATLHLDQIQISTEYAEKPIMWSPKAPSQIESTKEKDQQQRQKESLPPPISEEDYTKCQSVRQVKQRVAHKPTIPKNKQNRPKMPLGTSKKIPLAFRVKYLDVIINEYLNTGHKEEDSYQEGLQDEKSLADRASTKSIYVNLVAGLKKKIREKAGVSTLPQDEDPKFVNGNKVVSHEDILTGKVKGTFSIERKRKLSDPSDLNEQDLYDRLSRYLMPQDQVVAYGYPCRDPDNPRLRLPPLGKDGQRLQLRAELAPSYICERCAKSYRIGEDGMPLTTNKCIFHPGHLWNERINKSLEKRYSCCKGDPAAGGCSSNLYHVHRGELELENYSGYVETEDKPEREPNKHGIFALDCEMSYTTYGLELTRITVVNYKNDVVYEKLVKPKNPILDYNTKYSGIKPGDLDHVDTTLSDVQRDLLRKFSSKTILVGHSLDSDMRALKIFHKYFIDTAQLFPHKRGLPFKRALRTLMVENLRVIIQEDAGHDSKEDACAAFRLVMWKAKTDVPVKSI